MTKVHANGIEINYEDAGSGPAVVFVHGFSADLGMWSAQVDDLVCAGYRVVRLDTRGHGESEVPDSGYTWENYVADLAGVLDHLGIERAHLVGCSMGGAIALAFAVMRPERAASIALVDAALPGFTYSTDLTDPIEALRDAVREEGAAPAFDRIWLAHRFFDGVRQMPEVWAEIRASIMRYPAREMQADYPGEGDYAPPDIASRLHEIACSALVTVGEKDIEDFQLIAEILTSTIPGARKVVFEGAWHMPNMEQPKRFNRVLAEFLQSQQ